jgi:hypothetical protein
MSHCMYFDAAAQSGLLKCAGFFLADKVNKYTIQGNMREEVAAREVDPRYPRCLQCMTFCALGATESVNYSGNEVGREMSL